MTPAEILNFVNGFSLVGIPAIVLLPFLLEGLKRLGMPTHWTGFVAVGLGLLIALLIGVVEEWPVLEVWVRRAVFGLLLGLAVPGLYSQVQLFRKGNPLEPPTPPNAQAEKQEAEKLADGGSVLPTLRIR